MKTKTTITLGALAVGLLIASSAFAQGKDGKGDGNGQRGRGFRNHAGECRDGNFGRNYGKGKKGDGFRGARQMHQLDLTADQQAKLDKIKASSKKTSEPIRAEIKQLKEKMRTEWMQQKPGKATILSLHEKINGLNRKLAERRISDRLEMISILTPAQRIKMIEQMERRGKREARGDKRGERNGKGRDNGRRGPAAGTKANPSRTNS